MRLGLGAIKVLGEVWAIGHVTVGEIQVIARDILSLQKSSEDGTSANGLSDSYGTAGSIGGVEMDVN